MKYRQGRGLEILIISGNLENQRELVGFGKNSNVLSYILSDLYVMI